MVLQVYYVKLILTIFVQEDMTCK